MFMVIVPPSLLNCAALLKTCRYVIAPFTTRPQKHWFEDSWRELIPRITHELGLPVVMLGGPGLQTGSARTLVIYHALECSPCRRRPTCGGAFTWMRGITSDEVLAAALMTVMDDRHQPGSLPESRSVPDGSVDALQEAPR